MSPRNVIKDVEAAIYAASVAGIVNHYAYYLRLLTTYGAIASSLKSLPRGGQLAQALALIMEEDVEAKSPLRTAVVVNQSTNFPGSGFFAQCRQLGVLKESDDRAFWEMELRRLGVAPFTLEQEDRPQVIERTFKTPTTGNHSTVDGSPLLFPGQAEISDHLREQSTIPVHQEVWTPTTRVKVGDIVQLPASEPLEGGLRGKRLVHTPVRVTEVRAIGRLNGTPIVILTFETGASIISQELEHVKVVHQAEKVSEEPASSLPG